MLLADGVDMGGVAQRLHIGRAHLRAADEALGADDGEA
jgi:hypothetical protein